MAGSECPFSAQVSRPNARGYPRLPSLQVLFPVEASASRCSKRGAFRDLMGFCWMKKRLSREEFFEVVEALCRRPKGYTPSGSFNEVICFLEGYALGADLDDKQYHSRTAPFRKWLTFKLANEEVTEDWESIFPLNWDEILEHFSSESEALPQISLLYSEYCEFRAQRAK